MPEGAVMVLRFSH